MRVKYKKPFLEKIVSSIYASREQAQGVYLYERSVPGRHGST
jgi:hypothetical protein